MSDTNIKQLLRNGISYANEKQFRQAITAFTKILKVDSHHGDAFYYRGYCWANINELKRAEKDFSRALKYDGPKAKAAYQLGKLNAKRQDFERALVCFSKAAQLGHPKASDKATKIQLRLQGQPAPYKNKPNFKHEIDTLFEQAMGFMELAQWDDGLQTFAKLLALDEDHWPAYSNRGAIYLLMGKPEKAANEFKQALTIAPKQAAIYYNRAKTYFSLGHYEEALADINHLLGKLNPTKHILKDSILLRAQIYTKQGKFEQAELDFGTIQDIFPDDTAVFLELGLFHLYQKNIDQAIEMFQKAIQRDPKLAEAHYQLGTAELLLNHPKSAIDAYTKAILIQPDVPHYYLDRGVAYGRIQDTQNEIADLQKAITLNPQYAMAHYNLGFTKYRLKQYEDAIIHLSKAIECNAFYLEAYTTRGSCHLQLGKAGSALADYQAALNINPNDQVTQQNVHYILQQFHPENRDQQLLRATLYANMFEFEKAIADFNALLQKNPQDSEVLKERGSAFMQMGYISEAIQDFDQARTKLPNDVQLLVNQANAYLMAGQFDDALRISQKAQHVAPEDPKANHAVANAYAKLGNYEEAISFYTEAIRLAENDPDIALSFNSRGIAYSHLGEEERALQDFQNAIKCKPDHGKAHFNIGGIMLGRGEYKLALDAFTNAVNLGYEQAREAIADTNAQIAHLAREKEIEEALQTEPNNADLIAERALIYAQTGRYEQASKDVKHVLHLDKQQAPAYVAQALIYSNQNKMSKAFGVLNKLIKMQPQYGLAYVIKAELFKHTEQTEQVLETYQAAVDAQADDAHPAYSLGNYFLHHGKYAKAKTYLEIATQIDPKMSAAYYDLGAVYGRLGDDERAFAYYERAAELGDPDAKEVVANLSQYLEASSPDSSSDLNEFIVPSTNDLIQQSAQLLAEFAYQQCGDPVERRTQSKKGFLSRLKQEKSEIIKWQVVIEELTTFDKSGFIGEKPGATLELYQQPIAIVRLSVMDDTSYQLMLMVEKKIPGIGNKQATVSVLSEDIEANSKIVLARLQNLVHDGYLAVENGRLIYTGKNQSEP